MLKDYLDIRLEFYNKRKEYYLKVLENELDLLKYRRMFIQQILNKEIIIERRKKELIIQDLVKFNYPELSTNINNKSSYDYLTTIPLFSLTLEKIDELENDFNSKTQELESYRNLSIQDMWIYELDTFEILYNKWIINRFNENLNDSKITKIKNKNKSKKVIKTN